jgi:PKD repeat protein
MALFRSVLWRVLIVSLSLTGVVALPTIASASLPQTSTPTLKLERTIQTSPFVNNSSVSMKDDEGSAYVARDNSLWLADDNGRSIYEVDPITGYLKRVINRTGFEATKQFSSSTQTGSGPTAGKDRSGDLESMAYDAASDTLYAFSGKCCTTSELPTVFRLKRVNGVFQLESYQPLASGSDFTAAAWNSTDGKLYVGASADIRTYDYVTNTPGGAFNISGVKGIYGMSFSDDGADLFVVGKSTKLYRVTWATKSLTPGWTFDVSPFGLMDTRAVELIGDQFYLVDGYDFRPSGDPLSHAVFVLGVVGSSTIPPTASFNTSTNSGTAPLSVTFTDTSTGGPTNWSWNFGDGGTSTSQSPTHVFNSVGTFTVTLVASNTGGPSAPASTQIQVSQVSPPTASFNTSTNSGTAPLSVTFTDTSTGGPTNWSWNFGDGGTSTSQNPTHVFDHAGTYTVTLVASNSGGASAPASSQIQVSQASGSQTITLNPSADTTVSSYSPSKNYGSYTTLTLKLSDIEYLSLLTFSVQSLPAGVVPTSAHLRLYVTDGGPDGGTWFRSPTNWNESTVTWLDAPTIDPTTSFASTGSVSPGQWIDIDVTQIVTGNGTFGFAARTSNSDRVIYSSREWSNPPQLVLSYPT